MSTLDKILDLSWYFALTIAAAVTIWRGFDSLIGCIAFVVWVPYAIRLGMYGRLDTPGWTFRAGGDR